MGTVWAQSDGTFSRVTQHESGLPSSIPIHLRNQPPQLFGVGHRKLVNPPGQPRLANNANLVHSNLGRLASTNDRQPTTPLGVQLAGEGTDHHRLQQLITQVVADDYDRAGLANLTALHRIKPGEVNIVALHFFCSPGKWPSPSGRDSQSDQSSSVWAICW